MSFTIRLAKRTPFFYGWMVVFAAGTTQFTRNSVAALTLAVFVYPISQDLEWSRTTIAGAASAGGLASSIASPFIGKLLDKYGVRLILTISILILGLSTISLAWATIPLLFYISYGLGRVIFSSSVQIGTSIVVSQWFIRRRGIATGILFLCHASGMILFPIVSSTLIHSVGWQNAWIVTGILVWIIALFPVSLLILQRPEDAGLRPDGMKVDESVLTISDAINEPGWTLSKALSTKPLWILAIAGGNLFLIQTGVNIHIGAYVLDRGLSFTLSASVITVNAVFAGIGSIVWGWLCDRFEVRWIFTCVAIAISLASALFIFASSTSLLIVSAALFGFGIGGMLVVPPVAFANYFGLESLGAIRGITEPFSSMGQAIGAVLSGFIYDSTGSYQLAFISFTILACFTALALAMCTPPKHQPNN